MRTHGRPAPPLSALDEQLARIDLQNARGHLLAGLLAAPGSAFLWNHTCSVVRAHLTGLRDLPDAPSGATVWLEYAAYGLYEVAGMTGLHVLFGAVVLAFMALALWGSRRTRSIERRIPDAVLRRWALAELAPALEERAKRSPGLRKQLDEERRGTSSATSAPPQARPLATLLGGVVRAACFGATGWFAWSALHG